MPKIVKLAELLPPDLVIEDVGGTRYSFPGDPPLELVLRIAALYERSQNGDDEEGVGLDVLEGLNEEILRLLRMRDPGIEQNPFGVLGVAHVVGELLRAYNFAAEDVAAGPPQAPAAKRRSTRSTGSGRSSSSSASRRGTGAR